MHRYRTPKDVIGSTLIAIRRPIVILLFGLGCASISEAGKSQSTDPPSRNRWEISLAYAKSSYLGSLDPTPVDFVAEASAGSAKTGRESSLPIAGA